MKKILSVILMFYMLLSLAACFRQNSRSAESRESTQSTMRNKDKDSNVLTGDNNLNILIAYFSRYGNTNYPDDVDALATASIQLPDGKITGNTVIDQGKAEKNNNEKTKLSTHIESLSDYDTVFVGFSNWCYGMPMKFLLRAQAMNG